MLSSSCRFLLKNSKRTNIRNLLSSAYKCQEVWEQRKRAPIFQKVDFDDLYHQLDKNLQIGNRISMLDVDLFASGISGELYQNELEDILFKVRLNPETGLMTERTMHAVVKYYIDLNKKQDLLPILSNRLGYGIFPDAYLSNLLIDSFLKDNDFIGAAKIAVLQMLQEDFDHPILQKLSLLACIKYLNSPQVWQPPKEPEIDPDEEEEKVRVSFIRNPYFDDHFDLVDTNHLIGKTLHMAGECGESALELSCQLVGLALYEKFEALDELLGKIETSKKSVYGDALTKVEEYLNSKPKQPEGAKPQDVSESVVSIKSSIIARLQKIKSSQLAVQGDLETAAKEAVEDSIKLNESQDIQQLTKLYRQWETERENHLQFEIRESKKRKIAAEIEKTKEELAKREEVIFFFDKEDEWKIKVEEKEQQMKALEEQQRKYNKKGKEEEYIPPEV